MNPRRPHHHDCQQCGKPAPCSGELELNHDGFPAVICRDFHLDGGIINRDFRCETCAAVCGECGQPCEVGLTVHPSCKGFREWIASGGTLD